jgi:hypothetical protein
MEVILVGEGSKESYNNFLQFLISLDLILKNVLVNRHQQV